jgi:hypothetical protein
MAKIKDPMIPTTPVRCLRVQRIQNHQERRTLLHEQARKQHQKILKDLQVAIIKRKQFEKNNKP